MSIRTLAVCAFGALIAVASPAAAGDGTNLVPMLPENTQVIITLDVADARDSPLLTKSFDKLLSTRADAKAKLAEIGIDPLKDLDTVMFAAGGDVYDGGDAKSVVLIIEGRLSKDMLAKAATGPVSTYQGVKFWTSKETEAALIGKRMVFTKLGQMKSFIDIAQNKGKHKGKNAAASAQAAPLRAALATTKTSADLWITAVLPEKVKSEVAKGGMSINAISAGADFGTGLTLAVRLDAASAEGAKRAVELIQGQLAQVTQALGTFGLSKAAKSLLVSHDKAAILASAALTEAEIDALLKLAGGLGN